MVDARPVSGARLPAEDDFRTALRRARGRRGEGFDWLANHFTPAVKALAIAERCPDPDRTVANVLVDVFEGLPGFRGGYRDFCVLLEEVTRFHLVDQARARRRGAVGDADLAARFVALTPRNVVEEPDTKAVAAVMERLGIAQRTVLALRVFFGLTAPDVAAGLGVELDHVLTLQRGAEQRLDGASPTR